MNTSMLAVALLAMFAVGGVVYALLYPTLSGEKRAEKRRKEFAGPSTVRGIDREAQARNKRGQIAQSLKEIENRENARNKVSWRRASPRRASPGPRRNITGSAPGSRSGSGSCSGSRAGTGSSAWPASSSAASACRPGS